MNDIVINGISIAELNKQRLAIQEDASRLMSERVDAVKVIVETIIEAESKEVAETAAAEADKLLCEIDAIHNASGVEYYMPYSDEYNYDGNAGRIEDVASELGLTWRDSSSPLVMLQSSLEEMESIVRVWNTSTC